MTGETGTRRSLKVSNIWRRKKHFIEVKKPLKGSNDIFYKCFIMFLINFVFCKSTEWFLLVEAKLTLVKYCMRQKKPIETRSWWSSVINRQRKLPHPPSWDPPLGSTPSPAEAGHLWRSASASPQEPLWRRPRWRDPTYANTRQQSVSTHIIFISTFSTVLPPLRTRLMGALISARTEQTYKIIQRTTNKRLWDLLAWGFMKMKHNLAGNVWRGYNCTRKIKREEKSAWSKSLNTRCHAGGDG